MESSFCEIQSAYIGGHIGMLLIAIKTKAELIWPLRMILAELHGYGGCEQLRPALVRLRRVSGSLNCMENIGMYHYLTRVSSIDAYVRTKSGE